jgi:hypothetical protein
MSVVRILSLLGLALGLAVAGISAFGIFSTGPTGSAMPEISDPFVCNSCDARHARLASQRDQITGGTE